MNFKGIFKFTIGFCLVPLSCYFGYVILPNENVQKAIAGILAFLICTVIGLIFYYEV